MTSVPTISQNAPYTWSIESDQNGQPINAGNPSHVKVDAFGGVPITSNYPNPTTLPIAAMLMGFNGNTWDQVKTTQGALNFTKFTGVIWVNNPPIIVTTNGNSGDLFPNQFVETSLDINITAISGTIQFTLYRRGADTVLYQIYQSAVINAVSQISTSIGAGCQVAQAFGGIVQVGWVVGGMAPSITFTSSMVGK